MQEATTTTDVVTMTTAGTTAGATGSSDMTIVTDRTEVVSCK